MRLRLQHGSYEIDLIFPGCWHVVPSILYAASTLSLFGVLFHAIYSSDTNEVPMIRRCDSTHCPSLLCAQAVIRCHQIGPYRSIVRQAAAAFFVVGF